MRIGSSTYRVLVVLVSLALVVGLAAVVVYEVTARPTPPVQIQLTIGTDDFTGYLSFSPTTFDIPTGAVVHFQITNYDTQTHPVNPVFCNVSGTTDGLMHAQTWSGQSMVNLIASHVSPTLVSHTFTMISGGYEINVPLPPALSANQPSVTTFTFASHGAGVTAWTCEAGLNGPYGSDGSVIGFFDVR